MRTHPEAIGTLGVLYKRSCRKLRKKSTGTGYGRWGRVFLFFKSTQSADMETTQNCSPFSYRSIATKSEVARLLAVPLDASDVFNDIRDTEGFLYGTYSR